MKDLVQVLHIVEQHYCGSEGTRFEEVLRPESSDAVRLLRVIQDGLEAVAEREKRIQEGRFSATDIQAPRPI